MLSYDLGTNNFPKNSNNLKKKRKSRKTTKFRTWNLDIRKMII